MKLFPLLPIIFMLAYLFVGVSISIADPTAALTGVAVLTAFIILYFILHQNKKNQSNNNDGEVTLEKDNFNA